MDDPVVPLDRQPTPHMQRRFELLGRDHEVQRARRGSPRLLLELDKLSGFIDAVHEKMCRSRPVRPDLAAAAEWLMDNHYRVRRAVRLIREHLPPGFQRRLPVLATDRTGCSRLRHLAKEILTSTALQVDATALDRCLEAYQRASPLTIGELWALPTLLRFCAVESLAHSLASIDRTVAFPLAPQRPSVAGIQGIARAIRLLHFAEEFDWREFFRRHSIVEATLRADPAGAFAAMDFETRDRYRKAVEELAWGTRSDEARVAQAAVALADGARCPRHRHVGYWLVDSGRGALETELGYRPPIGQRFRRRLQARPAAWYIGAIVTVTMLMVVPVALYHVGSSVWLWLGAAALTLIPASTIATTIVQWITTALLPPHTLPKLDFEQEIPREFRTAVVIPTLLGNRDEIVGLVRQLEIHYLSNPEPGLCFALLTDHLDAPEPVMPGDRELVQGAEEGIRLLNSKYGEGLFHLLHRERRHNPGETCWIGWERKRGKLQEFNRWLRGARDTSFVLHVGDPAALEGVRFVITLDSDTQLPRGAAKRLVGTLAHPLNRASFAAGTSRLESGYTVLQPRTEISPEAGNRSLFSRLFSGETGLDLYTRAVSDVYQDLAGEGIYAGKGIYDVDAFERSLAGSVPENALASHDLFEGIHGRAALCTDIVLLEDYPPHYLAFARRMHRWVRGDWQLLPWLRSRVPAAGGRRIPNKLSPLDRWKVFDNLRRSLLAPALLLFLAAGWLWLPGDPFAWTLAGLFVPGCHIFTLLVGGVARGAHRRAAAPLLAHAVASVRENIGRYGLAIVFLAYEGWVTSDAIVRVLGRLVTRKRLLQWTSAAHTTRLLARRGPHMLVWAEMIAAPLTAVLLGGVVAVANPAGLAPAAPVLLLWFLSPEIARRISSPRDDDVPPLMASDRLFLRKLARRTWLWFETFVGPEDRWLAPDHFQENPKSVSAHRTSPTNIGLMLTSTLAARDFGWIALTDLAFRLRNSLDSIGQLQRYRGHLLNWYDTRTLNPLEPRYVSTVDSGNLAGCLIAVKQGCAQAATSSVLAAEMWDGLRDTLALIQDAVDRIEGGAPSSNYRELDARIRELRDDLDRTRARPERYRASLEALATEGCPSLEHALVKALRSGAGGIDIAVLRELRRWLERLRHQVETGRREANLLMPWLGWTEDLGDSAPPADIRLSEIPAACAKLRAALDSRFPADSATLAECVETLDAAARNAHALRDELLEIAVRAEQEVLGMDFQLLYDGERKLFFIGYNVTHDIIDKHHYDLLASEARLASFIAIVKGDAPLEHWFVLGRPLRRLGRSQALMSWGASMFEYLMPRLLMRSNEHTLLTQSCRLAVDLHIAHGRSLGIPWGVSESGFFEFDADDNYQYRAFGVPGLGFKRGLENDRVVAPYASALAVGVRPIETVANLRRLGDMNAVGLYGLYEAVDFSPTRVPRGRVCSIVRSYMAHHLGMTLVSFCNVLYQNRMVHRFHRDSMVRTGDMLLHEQIPLGVASEEAGEASENEPEIAVATLRHDAWTPAPSEMCPQAHLLSNGTLTSVHTDVGTGFLQLGDMALTRWSADAATHEQGVWIWIKDEDTGDVWSGSRAPAFQEPDEYHVRFHAHKVEYHLRAHGISSHVEITVAPGEDVEIRRVSLTNESDRPRSLSLTSYCEPVLALARDDARHPAFSKLFVECEYVAEDFSLICRRREREPNEKRTVLLQRLVPMDDRVEPAWYETDRFRFLGTSGDASRPDALFGQRTQQPANATLDPILSLAAMVELAPLGRVRLAFVSAAAASRNAALQLARRYASTHAIDWVFEDAEHETLRRLGRSGVRPGHLPVVQSMLSALLHKSPALRAPAAMLASASPKKSALWGHGISGDVPILLVQVDGVADSEILQEVMAAHAYWREARLQVDLVILDCESSSYLAEPQEKLLRLLARHGSEGWVGKRGGVFLLANDQLLPGARDCIEACALAVLEDGQGPLEVQTKRLWQPIARLPAFAATEPARADEPNPPLRSDGLLFDNGFGGFSADGREYVIRRTPERHPPAPWCNVLANPLFGTLVSDRGFGFTWSENSAENRLTPWCNDPVLARPAEALYVRDEETAEFWTPTPLPRGPRCEFLVRHRAGCTRYEHNSHALAQSVSVWVPPEDPVKIVQLKLRNLLLHPRRLTLTYYAEWVLGNSRAETSPFIVSEFERELAALFTECSWNEDFPGQVVFLTADHEVHGVTCDRIEFLGRNRGMARPAALERWGLSGSVGPRLDPCAALQVHVDLAGGEEAVVHFVLGRGASRAGARELIARYRDPGTLRNSLAETDSSWDAILRKVQVRTPDPAMDLLLNHWLLYQTVAARLFARTGFYQSSGAFGFRDQLQDVMAVAMVKPEMARAQILDAASRQFEAGDVLHWWHPPSGRGVRTRCSDDLVWLPYVTTHYVRVTGDRSILDADVPFLTGEELRPEHHNRYGFFERGPAATLFEHCRRAIERAWTKGRHGLPLFGDGDWNDGMNRVGKEGIGESVWLAWFLCKTAREFGSSCAAEDLETWTDRAEELRQRIEDVAWDGNWYLRGFFDDGSSLGSHRSHSCAIDAIAQAWAVLSGAADNGRARMALHSVERRLVLPDDRLVLLLTPPFDRTDPDPGYIRAYPLGVRENGGQYSHAATWVGHAFAALGDGVRTNRVFQLLNPILRCTTARAVRKYRVEPYVVAADIASVQPHKGRGGWTWYTGAAAWLWRLGVEGILGLHLNGDQLEIDPCLPPSWSGFEAWVRLEEGRVLHLKVENPNGVCRSRMAVTVPLATSETEVAVRLER